MTYLECCKLNMLLAVTWYERTSSGSRADSRCQVLMGLDALAGSRAARMAEMFGACDCPFTRETKNEAYRLLGGE